MKVVPQHACQHLSCLFFTCCVLRLQSHVHDSWQVLWEGFPEEGFPDLSRRSVGGEGRIFPIEQMSHTTEAMG